MKLKSYFSEIVEAAMELALEEHRGKELIFIDTPGLARGEMEDGADLARLMAARRSLPISLLATGRRIPDDLEPATKERLTAVVSGGSIAETKHSLGAAA
jgi:flagellar biosynthesis GTPase FlhF